MKKEKNRAKYFEDHVNIFIRRNFHLGFIVLFFFMISNSIFSQNADLNNRFMLGQSYEQDGDFQKANQIYQQLYDAVPDNYQFFDALNRTHLQLKQFDKSISLIKERLKLFPQDINLKGMLGSSYYLAGDENAAFKTWDEALAASPQSSNNYRVIANYAIERRVFNKAVEYLTKGKKNSKDDSYLSFELANLDAMLMRYKDAMEEYCSVLAKQPSQLTVVQSRITSFINKQEAINPITEVIEKWSGDIDNIEFKILLAWIYIQTDRFDRAYEQYVKIEEQHKSGGSDLFLFAQQAYNDKHYPEASQAYKKIMDDYPKTALALNAEIGFAKTLEAQLNEKSEAEDYKWKPFYKPMIRNNDDYNQVISAYLQLTKNGNNEIAVEAYYRIGLIQLKKFLNPEEAGKYFQKVISINPGSRFTILSQKSLAEMEIVRGRLDIAENYYNKIISSQRSTIEEKNLSTLMIARINFWRGNFINASDLLKSVVKNLADNSSNDAIELSLLINTSKNDSLSLVKFAEAELLAQRGEFDKAMEIYSALSTNNNLLTINDLSLLRKSEMLIALDKYPEAIVQLKGTSEEKEKNIYSDESLLLLGKVYQFGIKDLIKARETYENLLANFPNSLYLDDARENINMIKNKVNKIL